jgi:hypothetical protein
MEVRHLRTWLVTPIRERQLRPHIWQVNVVHSDVGCIVHAGVSVLVGATEDRTKLHHAQRNIPSPKVFLQWFRSSDSSSHLVGSLLKDNMSRFALSLKRSIGRPTGRLTWAISLRRVIRGKREGFILCTCPSQRRRRCFKIRVAIMLGKRVMLSTFSFVCNSILPWDP